MRAWLFVVAVTLFGILAVVAFRALPDGVELRPWALAALAVVGAPAIWLVNALEYRTIAKAAGHEVSIESAVRVSFTASVANLLPVPGGVAVRMAALKLAGSTLRTALAVNMIAGVVWVGATAALVGLALLTEPGLRAAAVPVTAIGLATIAGSGMALRRRVANWRGLLIELTVIEAASTLVAVGIVTLSFWAIGQSVSVAAAATLASSAVIAAAIGIFPAGFGIREAIAGGLALAVSVPAATAVAASVVERSVTLATMGIFAIAIGVRLSTRSRGDTTTEAPLVQASSHSGDSTDEG